MKLSTILTRKIFLSLFTAFLTSLAAGLAYFTLLLVLFPITSSNAFLFITGVGSLLNFFVSGFICVLLLLPVSILDKKNIETASFKELLERYLPLIAIPFGILFCTGLFTDESNSCSRNIVFIFTLDILCVGYTCVWVFLKRIKS